MVKVLKSRFFFLFFMHANSILVLIYPCFLVFVIFEIYDSCEKMKNSYRYVGISLFLGER